MTASPREGRARRLATRLRAERARRLASARGLTLVEVLVAVAITALLGSVTYGIVFTTIRTQEDAISIQDRFHAGRVALEHIRRELTMAFVSLHQADDKRTKTLFKGERSSIIFDTAAHETLSRNVRQSDQMEVEYSIKRVKSAENPDVNVEALVKRCKYRIDDRPGVGGREEVLIEGVRAIEFSYYDKFREDWKSEWDVEIDDAVPLREKLHEITQLREKADAVRDDEQTGVAGVAVAAEADKQIDEAQSDLMDGLFLPSRVRIRLTLENFDDVVNMETQIEIPLIEPLWY